jgi:hypothetical protein
MSDLGLGLADDDALHECRRAATASQARSRSSETPSAPAQCAQQNMRPSDSTPWPMIRQPQCAHVGASA